MKKRSLFLPFLLCVAIVGSCIGCKTTSFPERPPPHEVLQAIEAWPDTYYWLVETGVSSRVLGLRQPGASIDDALGRVANMLDAVKRQWGTISSLPSAQAIMEHFKANNLTDIAHAIQQTLDANQAKEPSANTHTILQARAIKQGLIDAYGKIQKRRGSL